MYPCLYVSQNIKTTEVVEYYEIYNVLNYTAYCSVSDQNVELLKNCYSTPGVGKLFMVEGRMALTLSPERQSARMSKITNDGLTRSGTGCFIAVPI